jgi:three-Cys-motif partner protein
VGEWAYEKIFHLHQYFGIFSKAMAGKWDGLNYVEICSGPGRCIFKETGEEVDGTALAILNHPGFHLLNTALFIDHNKDTVDVLNKRIAQLGWQRKAVAEVGDYTDTVGIMRLLARLPDRHLKLVFIDPTDCSVPFLTVGSIIKGLKYVDLIINLPVYMDAGRNLAKATIDAGYGKARQKYAEFLGVNDFFDREPVQELARAGNDRALRTVFRDVYRDRLGLYGHTYTALHPIRNLYELLFASGHERGLKFWNETCVVGCNGQREMDLEA